MYPNPTGRSDGTQQRLQDPPASGQPAPHDSSRRQEPIGPPSFYTQGLTKAASEQTEYRPAHTFTLPTRSAPANTDGVTASHFRPPMHRATTSSGEVWSPFTSLPSDTIPVSDPWGSRASFDAPRPFGQMSSLLVPPGLSYTQADSARSNSPAAFTSRRPQDNFNPQTAIGRPLSGMLPDHTQPHMDGQGQHRRTSGKDEFDGPHQFLPKPDDAHLEISEDHLLQLRTSLQPQEQDEILAHINDCLSQCAFHFVAKYQFPIPIEPDKRPVRVASDREWTEWCHLLKRLATKRRIPMRVLWKGQIKQLVTVLENSLEMRHSSKAQSRPLKDDRNVLQLISAALQVAKMLKDPRAMVQLDELYSRTENLISQRRNMRPP